MKKETKAMLLLGLKNGMGFTGACEVAGLDPKEVSTMAAKDASLMKEMVDYIENGKRAMMVLSNEYYNQKKFNAWKASIKDMRYFQFKLVLWESFCKRVDINPRKVAEAAYEFGSMREAATAIGMTSQELGSYMISNPLVKRAVDYFKD